ncbi:MAG: hypothetical protein RR696_13015, partial [Clostridia bacterium]
MVSLHFMGSYSKSAVRAVYTRPAVRAAFAGLSRALLCVRPLAECYVPCCACDLWRIAARPAVRAAFGGLLR